VVDELDPAVLVAAEDGEPPPVPAPAPRALDWRLSPDAEPVSALVDAAPEGDGFDLGDFTTWLSQAGVLDTSAIELPGATVTLPFGMGLIGRMARILNERYERYGYQEHDYPMLIPATALEPTRELMSLENSLVLAGDDRDWAAGRKRMVLTPTGEGAVYTHWARSVRTEADLPIRAYRRTRYFRPARAGRSVFRAIEALDVFEFQSCYADENQARLGFADALRMSREVATALHVPVLWATRPPWTNNDAVAEQTIGGDVPLPHGSTIQVGSIYRQGQRFSRAYDVGYHRDGKRINTWHVTGALTRRMLLMHLMLGMDTNGELLVHPDLAPVQIALTMATDDPAQQAESRRLADALTESGVRCELRLLDNRKDIGRVHRLLRRQGVPLRIYLQPRRTEDDRIRVVIVRADTREEAVLRPDRLTDLTGVLRTALSEVGVGYLRRTRRFVADRCQAADRETAKQVLTDRAVAVLPLTASRDAVEAVAAWGLGEVLGLRRADIAQPCVITGRPTTAVAFVSARR
jgi:prolyl-tRNA synthetase